MYLVVDAGTTVILMPNASGSRPQLSSARLRALTRVLSRGCEPSTSLSFQLGCNCRTWRGSSISAKALVQQECGWFAKKIFVLFCPSRPVRNEYLDRKSTRLNSSHQIISYAVFCLKKKKQTAPTHNPSPTPI